MVCTLQLRFGGGLRDLEEVIVGPIGGHGQANQVLEMKKSRKQGDHKLPTQNQENSRASPKKGGAKLPKLVINMAWP